MIAQTIQLALAPVFVLVAMGNFLNVMSSRLSRVVDRSRELQGRHVATSGREHDMIVAEMRLIHRRMELVTSAIRRLVIAGLAIGATVTVLFLEELIGVALQTVAAGFFLVAVGLLMWALVLFLREIQVAAAQLRIPNDFLELERDL